ncbi:outer membrane beta-barrel protein [Fontimonas sp. SYSU GA230001]|uniref:outer membrane beta-barrel protein n=1 Tax=Fontimonas sp. SYSU GA230001 TaxID=3142450 RepID=UPI0032B54812
MHAIPGILLVALLGLSTSAFAAGGNVVASIGARYLDRNEWGPVEDQGQIGVLADLRIGPGPFYLAGGIQISGRERSVSGGSDTGSVVDFSLGMKFMPARGQVRPYVGAGIASVGAAYEVENDYGPDDDDNDGSLGYYYGIGVLVRFGQFNVGADVRRIAGTDLELFGRSTDADSTVVSALFGWNWGE